MLSWNTLRKTAILMECIYIFITLYILIRRSEWEDARELIDIVAHELAHAKK